MTIPTERYSALVRTKELLEDMMLDFELPKEYREKAYRCLKHYPGMYHLEILSDECPTVLKQE